MLSISPRVSIILDALNNRYASQTYRNFYGKSPYRNWQVMFDHLMYSLVTSPNKYGTGLIKTTEWGDIIYSRIKNNNVIFVSIDGLRLNFKLLHNWFIGAAYPPTTKNAHSTHTINSINYVRPFRTYRLQNGNAVYAVQSDTHLYSLADRGKNLVIKKWFNSLSFPIHQKIGDLEIIGYGTVNGVPYYIDSILKMHHAAEIAQMQKPKIESVEKTILRFTEKQFYGLISECVKKILREIA